MTDSFTLVINSSNLSNPNTNGTYTYNFIGGGFKIEDDMYVMLSSAQIPYSIFNITSAYNNNRFNFLFPSGSVTTSYTLRTITIPDGFYTIEDLNAFMQQYAITNGLYLINDKSENVYYTPAFYVNPTSYAIQILLYAVPRSLPAGWSQPTNWTGYSTFTSDRTPYIVILSNNNFQDYIGFLPGTYPPGAPGTAQTTNYSVLSNKKPPIATYVNSIIVHCSLVNNPVVSPSDILDAFQISNTSFGENINYSPSVEKYVKLTKGSYSSMIITLTDQNNNPINLIDPNILITLLFKSHKK
jgi:hypothetical protein